MIKTLRAIGNSCGLIIDGPILELFKLEVGSQVEVTVAPDGKGLLLTPVRTDAAGRDDKAAHESRVREASQRAIKKHGTAFKKLAE